MASLHPPAQTSKKKNLAQLISDFQLPQDVCRLEFSKWEKRGGKGKENQRETKMRENIWGKMMND